MLTDKQKGEVKCEHFKSLHDSNKSVRLDKVGFVTDHSRGAEGELLILLLSVLHDNTMTGDTVGEILMEFLVAPA